MALAPNPPICLLDLKTEFGDANGGNTCLLEYYAGGSNVPAGTTGTQGAIPSSGTLCLTDFPGSSAQSIGSFPSLATGYTASDLSGSTSNTQFSFQKSHASANFGIQVAAFANIGFNLDTANDRIIVYFYSGTNASSTTQYYQEITYVGLDSATWECRYQYPDTTSAMPTYDSDGTGTKAQIYLPTTDSLSENTWYSIPTSGFRNFYHRALANYNSQLDNGHAIVGASSAFPGPGEDVRFEVRATSGSNTFTATSIDYTVLLQARRGTPILEP